MKEIEFDSDRYYVLRHDLETDSYDDYVHANAVAGGEIESVDVCDKGTIAIRTRTHGEQGGDKDCLVKIRYLDDGRWGPHSNDKGNRAVGCWFEKMPEVEQDDALFENCVFVSDIKLEGNNDVAFHNCFFLGSVNIEGCRNIYKIDLEHCIIKGDLTISNCETDVLSIWNCNVFRTVMIADCQVKKTVSMCDLYIKLGLHIRDSGFYGHESKLRGAKIGYGIEISDCDYDVMTGISLCKAEEVRIKDTVFRDLTMDCISTHSYFDYEHLIDNDSDTLEKGLVALPDNNDESDDNGLSKREKRFDNAMGTAVERKSSILFSNTTFNGITELSDITASLLGVCGCRAYDDFQISKQRMDSSYEAMEKYESDFCDTTERNYALQFIDLSGTIFYENTEISNVYRFICMNNTRFKEYCYIDTDYLNVTEGL